MANSISYKDKEGEVWVINADNICYAVFKANGDVVLQLVTGALTSFSGMNDREREALKRALRISPA